MHGPKFKGMETNGYFKIIGKAVKNDPKSILSTAAPIQIEPLKFFELCFQSIQNNEDRDDEILGICFSIGPYILSNYGILEENDIEKFWNLMIQISQFVHNFPIAFGYVEAVTELSVKSKGIHPDFLNYLSSTENNNDFLKPLLLVALYEFLPRLFLFKNTDYFLPQILNSFQIDNASHKTSLLLIISRFNLNMDIINTYPNFVNIVWQFIIESSFSETNFSLLVTPIHHFRELVPDFFNVSHETIYNMLELKKDQSILSIARLFPLLDQTCFTNAFQIIFNYASTINSISEDLNNAITDSLSFDFIQPAVQYLFSNLSTNLQQKFDSTSIYLFSLYFTLFEDVYNDAALILIRAINLAFSSFEANKGILCFAISKLPQIYLTRSKILKRNIIPALLNTISFNDEIIMKFMKDAFISLLESNSASPSYFLDNFISSFNYLLPKENVNQGYNINCIHRYLKVLNYILKNEKDENYILNISKFAQRILLSNSIPLDIKVYFIELSKNLINDHYDSIKESEESISIIAYNILFSDIYIGYPIVAEFMLYSNSFPDLPNSFSRLIDISLGKIVNEPKIIRLTSYFAALFTNLYSNETSKYEYPTEILINYLQTNDVIFISRAITNLLYLYKFYSYEILCNLLTQILNLAKENDSSILVNNALLLCRKLIKKKNDDSQTKYFNQVTEFIYSVLLGRINLLDHTFPFNYDSTQFKLYKLLLKYIENQNTTSLSIVLQLIDWLPLASNKIIPKIAKLINKAFSIDLIPCDIVKKIYQLLLDLLQEYWRDTEIANCLLALLVTILQYYPNGCNPDNLINQMNYMWESKDDEMILILPPIYFDIWANIDIPIQLTSFHTCATLLIQEQCDQWSFPLMIQYILKIVDKEPFELITDCALVISHFLLKTKEELVNLDFNDEIIEKMKQSLLKCTNLNNDIEGLLKQSYTGFPKKYNKLKKILE